MSDGNGQKGIVKYKTSHGEVSLSPSIIRKYLVNGDGRVSDQEVMMFMGLCRYQGLNPFLREAYLIKFGSNPATIVTGKDVFTKRAARDDDFNGFKAGLILLADDKVIYRDGSMKFDGESIVGGWAEVYRKAWEIPVRAEVSFDEYAGKKKDGSLNRQWSSKPGTMIRKVALVQALREAFPESFEGMYDASEMHVDGASLSDEPIHAEVVDTEDPTGEPAEDEGRKVSALGLGQQCMRGLARLKELVELPRSSEDDWITQISAAQQAEDFDELRKLRRELADKVTAAEAQDAADVPEANQAELEMDS